MAIIFKPRRSDRSKVSSGGTKATLVLEQGELFFVKNDTSGSTGRYNIYMGDGSTQIQSLSPALFGDTSEEDITLTTDSSTTSAAALANITSGKTLGSLLGSIKTAITKLKSETSISFTSGTNQFGVTIGGNASTVTVTPSIANNITGSGTNGSLAKFNGANTLTNGPQFGSSTTTYLRNDGSWGTPTDTKNTTGSTDTSSKIFLVGATSQAASAQTYSDNEVYVTNGVLTTESVQVGGTLATMQYNNTLECIEFIFS